MAPAFVVQFFLFYHLALLLSARSGNGNHDKCPRSFDCGELWRIHFPFTKPEQQDCGLIVVHNCDVPNSLKMIQLQKNGRLVRLQYIIQQNNMMTLDEQELHKRLQSNPCQVLNNNITLPPNSPLVSFNIKYNVTLFRCNHSLKAKSPTGFLNHTCPDFNIYYYSLPEHPPNYSLNSFSSCSTVVLPKKDQPDTIDLLSFLSGVMEIEVRLSDDCDNCYNHMGGHCKLDSNNKFYCNTSALYEATKNRSWILKLGLGLGIGLFIGLLGILIIWVLLGQHYKRKYASSNVQLQSTNNNAIDPYLNADSESGRAYYGIPLFSYEELEKATNDFDRSKELGDGGFGIVYYGKLQDGREVAIKLLYNHNNRRVEQFMNEIEILTRLRHQNLVSLYGCTSRQSRQLLLVYEYIPNGTVFCHLHGQLANHGLLPWPIRIKIAIEAATALAYLHASDIIHRDVKTNNILLDKDFCVKVADFGLSKLFPNNVTHVSTAPQGTPGYVDPEYHRCYQLTSKSDVYSFGVVLIELISSMPAVDMSRQNDEINLADLAIKKIQKSAFKELVDPSLGFESDNEVKRMIVSVAELALQCLQRDRELRPSMDEVLQMLKSIDCRKVELDHLEEGDIHGATRNSHNGITYPPSPNCKKVLLLKNLKSLSSPKAMIDQWQSESNTSNASAH